MEPIYQQDFTLTDAHVDCFGRLRLSMLLYFCQEVATIHGSALGASYEVLTAKNLFWAIIRQKVEITRLPMSGETIHVETWPMPTTRTYYPRSTIAYDKEGNELFRAIGMWVMMDRDTRAMVLPGKSGITVQGLLTGSELAVPGSLAPQTLSNSYSRHVGYTDLDRNGHMNNTRYLEWMADLLPSAFHRSHTAREFTVCYHAEAREGQQLQLHWQLDENDNLLVDALREEPESGRFHRVFSAKVQY